MTSSAGVLLEVVLVFGAVLAWGLHQLYQLRRDRRRDEQRRDEQRRGE